MDFRLSCNWLKDIVDVRVPPEELAERLSLHSVSVERLHRMDEGLDPNVIVGRVEKIEAHPNADKLRIAEVAVGAKRSLTKVVCGGTNLREGMLVAFAPPGAKVRWHGQGDPVALTPTEIRGVRSDGKICAASEIGLGEWFAEGEREVLDLEAASCKLQAASSIIGRPLAEALGLDDTILDCEITTNRPDLMSVAGLAREVATITGARMRAPVISKPTAASRKTKNSNSSQLTAYSLQLRIDDRSACPRYGAVVIDGVRVGPSPWWLQRRLIAAGLRPINNVVDATNEVMLELGQPLHAFDAAKLVPPLTVRGGEGELATDHNPSQPPLASRGGVQIVVRRASAGESLVALDGVTHALASDVLVIADAERPIALAGIMGGRETGVTAATTCIILECANFDPMVIRRGARSLNNRTDASTRFEKGLQPEAIGAVLPRAVELISVLTGGTAGKPIIAGSKPKAMRPITFRPEDASERIGVSVPAMTAQRTLAALGCRIRKKTPHVFSVTPPWWRRGDLEHAHDLVEEIARIAGYHTLPSVLPSGTLPAAVRLPSPPITAFGWEDRARTLLADTGGTEIMISSLTSRDAIEWCGFTVDRCVSIENPLSEELALLRPAMISTLLPTIAGNQEHTPTGVVFELGNVYIPKPPATSHKPQADRNAGLPREEMRLAIATYARSDRSGEHVMRLKGMVESLLDRLGITDVTFQRSGSCVIGFGSQSAASDEWRGSRALPATLRGASKRPDVEGKGPWENREVFPRCLWHPGRTMDVIIGETLVGVLGEIHPAVAEKFRIGARVAVAELDWAPILAVCGARRTISAPSAFPAVKRDLAFTVDRTTAYAEIAAVLDAFDPILTHFELFDTFEGAGVPAGKKSMAFHLTCSASERTLTAAEADDVLGRLAAKLRERFGAEIRE